MNLPPTRVGALPRSRHAPTTAPDSVRGDWRLPIGRARLTGIGATASARARRLGADGGAERGRRSDHERRPRPRDREWGRMAFDEATDSDFDRQRRRHALARIAARLRQEPDDVVDMLAFEDVVAALGRRSQTDLGVTDIPLDSIVGTVGRRSREFDRSFRPATGRLRRRWLQVASARRRGVDFTPIEVYRVGALHFVEDGHHRVSVARAMGDETIAAHVREVRTALPATPELLGHQLALKHHERLFHERVPLPPAARERIRLTDEWRYAQLAALIEAMGFRQTQVRDRVVSRE